MEWFTLAWMTVEGAVAIGAGIVAHSLTLLASGVDSVIEIASALVLVWRLTVELRQASAIPAVVEERASAIGGALLFGLAGYVLVSSGSSVW